jgi:conjugative transfer signal peptidase TraF
MLALWVRFGLGYTILFNMTNSLPQTLFLTKMDQKSVDIKRGDFVLFDHAASKMPIVKKVVGISGDVIFQKSDALVVNSYSLPLKETDSKGNPLKPLTDTFVWHGTVFVAGDHNNSLDSRYDTFGLVPLTQVQGVVWPIF